MTTPMIAYLLNTRNGIEGQRRLAYNYILAQNGVFLEAENDFIRARIRVVDGQIRGLEPLTERVELVNGRIPGYFLAMALRTMRQDPSREVYLAVTVDEGFYRMQQPQQERWSAGVRYEAVPNTVLDFHSHGLMTAHFSATDDRDDQGFRISAVIGKLDQRNAELSMRLGVYGYHTRVTIPEVFTGSLPADLVMAGACPERSRRER